MPSLFSRKPKVNDFIYYCLREYLQKFSSSMQRIANINSDKMLSENAEERESLYYRAIELIQEESGAMDKLISVWPEGQSFIDEMRQSIYCQTQMFNNVRLWGNLINKPSFNIFESEDHDRHQKCIMMNRKLGAEVDAHMEKADAILRHLTGKDLSFYFEN
jgi:hypothetical protein